jgi:hypothetical protein
VGTLVTIRPQDDLEAEQASDWCDDLTAELSAGGHVVVSDVVANTPPDEVQIKATLRQEANLACYFGHGDEHSWLTDSVATIDKRNVQAAAGKAVVSIACSTGCNLGPDAIAAGVTAWLGFTLDLPIIRPHKNIDPIGEAIVSGLACLGTGGTVQEARDAIAANLGSLVSEFRSGYLRHHPGASAGYFATMAAMDRVVAHGSVHHQPL